jgi:predicted molibdopterin-dependent oxidoreductase YjgC
MGFKGERMKLTIDGKEVEIKPEDKCILDLTDRAGVHISAPCYRQQLKSICCQSCLVEINGSLAYACGTVPEAGMKVIVKREDLYQIRLERLKKFSEIQEEGSENFTIEGPLLEIDEEDSY